jgi:predicted Zn-dependent protease
VSASGPPPVHAAEQLQGVITQVERLLDVGRPADARRTLAPALAAQPDDPALTLLAARVEDAAGDGAAARRLVADVLGRVPDDWDARVLHFAHLNQDDRHADAEQVILGLLREEPRHPGLLVLYARLMLETLRFDKARALTDEALRIAPDFHAAALLDAILSVAAGDDARAGDRVSELIAEDPERMSTARTAIAVFATAHRPKDALAIARSALRAAPGDARLVNAIVDLRMATHPLMLPYRPLVRYGWAGSAVMWGVGVGGIRVLNTVAPHLALGFTAVWLAYVVGSWAVPPLLRRHLARAGA